MIDQEQNESVIHFDVKGTRFFLLDPGETVAAETFCDSGYEPAVLSLLDNIHIRIPKAIFCDVGALHGYYSALVSQRFPNWFVHAFEPNPGAYEVLSKNFRLNSIRGTAHRVALTATSENVHFEGRTIVDSETTDAIVDPAATFDKFADESDMTNVIAKVDVHGAEGLVIAGMMDSLGPRVKHVLIEVHAQHLLVGPQTYEDIIAMLEKKGFEVYELEGFRYHTTTKLVPLKGEFRKQFVNFTLWQQEQIDRERMIYAKQ